MAESQLFFGFLFFPDCKEQQASSYFSDWGQDQAYRRLFSISMTLEYFGGYGGGGKDWLGR